MIQTTVEFKGLDQIEAAFKVMPVEFQRRVLRLALRETVRFFQEGMMRRAPRAAEHRMPRRGKDYPRPLWQTIGYRVRVHRDGDPIAEIGPLAFWGRFQETGTKFHAAQPFMRPTLEQDGQIGVSVFANAARRGLETIVRRLRRNARTAGG
jgi:HK97 gp10 family phage protein